MSGSSLGVLLHVWHRCKLWPKPRRCAQTEALKNDSVSADRRALGWEAGPGRIGAERDRLRVVEFQETAHLALLARPRLIALLRPERIIDSRQPVEGECFQH
jgi:hypothetical protein